MHGDIREKSEHYLHAIGVFVKYGLQIDYACAKLQYILGAIPNDRMLSIDTDAFIRLFGFDAKTHEAIIDECNDLKNGLFAKHTGRLDELTDEAREATLSLILLREIVMRGQRLLTNHFGISQKEYRKMRTPQDFAAAAMQGILLAIRLAYSDTPPRYSAKINT